jgi:probable HAF family extracellular repeat protein
LKIRNTVILFLLALAAAAVSAQTTLGYTYTIIDYPAAFNTGVFGINRVGQMSGTFFGNDGVGRAFIYADGKFNTINFPQAERTFGFGINDAGSLVGYYIDSGNLTHGFLYDGKSFSTIDYPKAKTTRASGINGTGQIVGGFVDDNGVTHGFIDSGGKFRAINFPGATRTEAYGINDAGWIVGYYADSKSVTHGFMDKDGVLTNVDFPGAVRTSPYGINKSGQISGTFTDKNRNHGFINAPRGTKLNFPGALSTFGFALNDSGAVVGQIVDLDSVDHGFLAVPGKVQAPMISARLDPDTIGSGINGFKLRVRGIGFVPNSVLQWNGSARPTTYVDDSNLSVSIPREDIEKPGRALVTIVNPGPNGGTSNVVSFAVQGSTSPQ